ncbi:hypothetical protein [Paenibacillus aceti]|uniref:hypothetical protein n=1 Tax=Paenibacillus aceti TaxID=1820010 RepID=UPI001E5A39DC|nr:hypothetical protein [Paenibacillus aceti]
MDWNPDWSLDPSSVKGPVRVRSVSRWSPVKVQVLGQGSSRCPDGVQSKSRCSVKGPVAVPIRGQIKAPSESGEASLQIA